ncbi:MAG: ABC transporter permease [Anaerolineales bacterium]|nr:ABC transporter permease [Anaerolineales bacterium]
MKWFHLPFLALLGFRKRAEGKQAKLAEETYYTATQFQLMWWKFRRHRLAIVGSIILGIFVFIMIFCEFLAPYDPQSRNSDYIFGSPQKVHLFDDQGKFQGLFVYGVETVFDRESMQIVQTEDRDVIYKIRFFSRGEPYKMWGIIRTDLHLFTAENGFVHLFGTDNLGRDVFSRILYGTRTSLSIGLIGIFISFIIGLLMGGISGYFGGALDNLIQRLIEFINVIPTLPLWMSLAAALPKEWSPIRVYFMVTIILSFISWTTLARRVRGKLISMREEDFVFAARIAGSSDLRIIIRHMLPAFLSYIIVDLTVEFPYMILGETTLSFIGLGLREPVVSWGVLLQASQNVKAIEQHPWLFIPAAFVIVSVLAFSLVGDGMRDAADPYSQ